MPSLQNIKNNKQINENLTGLMLLSIQKSLNVKRIKLQLLTSQLRERPDQHRHLANRIGIPEDRIQSWPSFPWLIDA